MTDDVSVESDVSVDTSTPASNEPASSAPATGEQTAQPSETSQEKPFHEHPRFQELVQQKNEAQQRISQYEKQLQEMQSQYEQRFQQMQAQLQPKPQQFDPQKFLQRAKQIDPEFAQTLEWQAEQARQLQQRIDAMNQERLRETATSKLQGLFEQNKVDAKMRPLYEAAIKASAYENPKFGINDLDKLFATTHETYSKLFDEMKRAERASYVDQKKKDATPATQTGGAAPQPGGAKKKITFEEAVQLAAADLRRAKQKI